MKAFPSRVARTAAALALGAVTIPRAAQDRLKTMPGYEQFERMSREAAGAVKLGSLAVQWNPDSSSFEYAWNGQRYRYDIATKQATSIGAAPEGAAGRGGFGAAGGQGGRGRGGQGQP